MTDLPGAQAMHDVEPFLSWYVPVAQSSQLALADAALYLPTSHFVPRVSGRVGGAVTVEV